MKSRLLLKSFNIWCLVRGVCWYHLFNVLLLVEKSRYTRRKLDDRKWIINLLTYMWMKTRFSLNFPLNPSTTITMLWQAVCWFVIFMYERSMVRHYSEIYNKRWRKAYSSIKKECRHHIKLPPLIHYKLIVSYVYLRLCVCVK